MCEQMHHCTAFSSNNHFASNSCDGVLQLWNCGTGSLQQFTPASHLVTTYTCLAWKGDPTRCSNREAKNKKDSPDLKFIILGTKTGEIFLFNSQTNGIVSKHIGHNDQVNDLCWHSDESQVFYSCSKDNHIYEWDSSTSTPLSKWKGDSSEIYTIRMGPQGRTIISASSIIKLWDLKTKKLLKKFAAHKSPVVDLLFVNIAPAKTTEGVNDAANSSYFVSAANDDRYIHVWQSKSGKKPLMSLVLTQPGKPRQIDVISSDTSNVKVLVVTEEGELNLFEQKLNGVKKSQPMKPSRVFQVTNENATPISIVGARFEQQSNRVQLVYGKQTKLAFDYLDLDEQTESILIREDPSKSLVTQQADSTKIRVPKKGDNVKVIVPGHVDHSGPVAKRKKENSIGHSVLTMEEQLSAISVKNDEQATDSQGGSAVEADSLAKLLSQGLHSDRDILNQVLQRGNQSLITKTVRKLPLPDIALLLKELTARINSGPDKGIIFNKWLKTLFTEHMAYFISHPNVAQLLQPLAQTIKARSQNLELVEQTIIKADCNMNLVLNQEKQQSTDINNQPLFVYNEDSEDEISDDDFMMEEEESDDEWDEDEDEEDDDNESMDEN